MVRIRHFHCGSSIPGWGTIPSAIQNGQKKTLFVPREVFLKSKMDNGILFLIQAEGLVSPEERGRALGGCGPKS